MLKYLEVNVGKMYKLKYWIYNSLKSKVFNNIEEALSYSVYKIPFQSFHSIDKI